MFRCARFLYSTKVKLRRLISKVVSKKVITAKDTKKTPSSQRVKCYFNTLRSLRKT
jgi:hypothetical protein